MNHQEMDKKLTEKLADKCNTGDAEYDYINAHKIISDFIRYLRLKETAKEFDRLKGNFWYA